MSTLSNTPPSSVLPIIFALKLNESIALAPLKSTISPLLIEQVFLYNIAIGFHMFLKNYPYILLSYTLILFYQYL